MQIKLTFLLSRAYTGDGCPPAHLYLKPSLLAERDSYKKTLAAKKIEKTGILICNPIDLCRAVEGPTFLQLPRHTSAIQ